MQRLPAFSPQAANPSRGRGKCQRNQENKSQESHGDVAPLRDVVPHAAQTERLIRADVRKKVQANVEEREQAEHAAEANKFGHIQELSQRSDRQCENEEAKSPITSGMLIELHRVGSQISAKRPIDQRGEWEQTHQKSRHFRPFAQKEFAHSGFPH